MFESRALGVVTGLAAIYLVLSLVVMSLVEIISSMMSLRARSLRDAIVTLIGEQLSKKVLANPAVKALGLVPPTGPATGMPSYIPSHLFARALLAEMEVPPGDQSVAAARKMITAVVGDPAATLEEAERRLAVWFDSAMDRLSGAYKRNMQKVSWVLALLVTVVVNVDSIHLIKALWTDPSVAARIGAVSNIATAACDTNANSSECQKELLAFVKNVDALPLGLDLAVVRALDCRGWALFVVGLALTALAVSRGAPFWFDFLRRFSPGLASTGPRPPLASTSPPAPAPPPNQDPVAPQLK